MWTNFYSNEILILPQAIREEESKCHKSDKYESSDWPIDSKIDSNKIEKQ